jgi:hypothetical protein
MTAVARARARLSKFVARASLSGIGPIRAIAWELPRLIAWRAYQRAAQTAYAMMAGLRPVDPMVRQTIAAHAEPDRPLFCVIVVPDVLHFLLPALGLLAPHAQIILVLNGASKVEERALLDAFPEIPRCRMRTLPGAPWSHGQLLSRLIRSSPCDFGILDHDFFLFKADLLQAIEPQPQEYAVAATAWRNSAAGISFPGTHLLYLQVSPLRELMDSYGIDARLYRRAPRRLRAVLASLYLSDANPPKEYQSFYDSFTLLSALASHAGYQARCLTSRPDDWVHVGGTSMGLQISKDALHHYINARFIGLLDNPEVVAAYRRRGLAMPGSASRLRARLEQSKAARIDQLVTRVSERASVRIQGVRV